MEKRRLRYRSSVHAAESPGLCVCTLPDELLEHILTFCDVSATQSMANTSQKMLVMVWRSCWNHEHWLAEHMPLRLLIMSPHVHERTCLARLDAARPEDCGTSSKLAEQNTLHLALEHRASSADLLTALLQARPSAAFERCAVYDMLALEYAAEQCAAPEATVALVELYRRDAALSETVDVVSAKPLRSGQLSALHLAAINGCSERVVRALLQVQPSEAARWASENEHEPADLLPLHFAAVYGARDGSAARVVELLYTACEQAVATREGSFGMLPLHLAALSAAPLQVIIVLAARFPEGLHVRDDLGRTPLDCAQQSIGTRRAGESTPGYTHLWYAGLNASTPRRLEYRATPEHGDAVVACIHDLTRSANQLTATPPATWRYRPDSDGRGTVVSERLAIKL